MKYFLILLVSLGCTLLLAAQTEKIESLEQGSYTEEIYYDEEGRPREIKIDHSGKGQETLSYSYEKDRIHIHTEGRDEQGQDYTWNDTLYLKDDGSLRMMERKGTGTAPLLGWDRRSGWISHEDFSEIITYNEQGQLEKRILFQGSSPYEEEHYLYDDRRELTTRILRNLSLDERWETEYFTGELIKEQRQYRSELLVSQTRYSYNEAGQPVERITLGRGQSESWTGIYNSSGRLSEENYFKDGLLSRRMIHGETDITEEIYSKGRLSLRIKYRDWEIISEEKFD